ncbi:neugrin [Daphnia magna]|uniref:neugrin n=1 Tax=Daphnia magna TaxID=35525 RepID=UPI001E1BA72B|nr:neugrin [Daphnia magna]
MWKVVTRLVQNRSLSTFSHNFSTHKGLPNSDTEFVQKKQRYKQTDDFGHPEKTHFRSRGSGYQDRNGNSAYSESRHNSFVNIVDNSWEESAGKNNRYSNKTDSHRSEYRDQGKGQYGEPRERGNANLSKIGVPGKWKVGAGFVRESDRLRDIQDRCRGNFKKMANFTIKREPGIRRQAKVLEEFSDPNIFPREEELDGEVDVVKLDKVYDKYQQNKQDIKELTKLRIVKQKYFKDTTEEKTLTWSDKEHIRFLHNSDPQQWTIEMIAEHFRIEPHVAKAVASAKWIPKKSKLQEEISSNSTEIYPPVNEKSEQQTAKRQSFEDKQIMTWHEVTKDMGVTCDAVSKNQSKSKPASVELEDVGVDKDLVLQYLSPGSPSKWASRKSSQTNVKLDEAEEVRQVIGKQIAPQQHLEIKQNTEDGEKNIGDVYQKGDAFFTSEGELLYRVPNLSK